MADTLPDQLWQYPALAEPLDTGGAAPETVTVDKWFPDLVFLRPPAKLAEFPDRSTLVSSAALRVFAEGVSPATLPPKPLLQLGGRTDPVLAGAQPFFDGNSPAQVGGPAPTYLRAPTDKWPGPFRPTFFDAVAPAWIDRALPTYLRAAPTDRWPEPSQGAAAPTFFGLQGPEQVPGAERAIPPPPLALFSTPLGYTIEVWVPQTLVAGGAPTSAMVGSGMAPPSTPA